MEWQPQGIPVEENGRIIPIPWAGGMTDSKPEFVDIDGDGDYDVFIGDNTGKLWYFENVGTAMELQWEFVSDFYDSIDIGIWSQPVFCDIDNDVDSDLFVVNGMVKYYYKNIGTTSLPYFTFIADTLSDIIGSTIDFGDFDNDGDFDIISGSVWYYENIGNQINFNYVFTDTIEMINYVKGRNICDLDNDADQDIVIGEDDGHIWYLRNDGTPYQYDFTVVTQNIVPDVGNDAAPTLVDIDGDGDLDMFVGTGTAGVYTPFGGIRYFENIGTPEVYDFQLITESYFTIDTGWRSVVRLVDIDADGDLDLFIGSGNGQLTYFENTGTDSIPFFTFMEENFQGLSPAAKLAPEFVDLDNDDDYDLLAGWEDIESQGKVELYENIGTPQDPLFEIVTYNYLPGLPDLSVRPTACDIDDDGDYDLLVTTWGYGQYFYRNEGTPEIPNFVLETENYQDLPCGSSFFHDIDDDGDFDLFMSYSDSLYNYGISYYENIGTPEYAVFILASEFWEDLSFHSKSHSVFFGDIDADDDADLFMGNYYDGGVTFYRNLEYNSVSDIPPNIPSTFSLHQNYPNPFNASTTIPFTLDRELPVKVVVYNGLGQFVATLIDGQISPGQHQLRWDAEMYSSGVYLITLEVNGYKDVKKMILVK